MSFEEKLNRKISEWQNEGIITEEQAVLMLKENKEKRRAGHDPLLLIFGVLGAILTGGGIILLFARNWSEFPVPVRTAMAFLPLLAAQSLLIRMYKKDDFTVAKREGIGVFYGISILACAALISQIYQLPGDFSNYLLLCSLLILPVCYICNAAMPAVIYIIGITSWTGAAYGKYTLICALLLMLPVMPYVIKQLRENAYSGISQILQWVLVGCGFVIYLPESANLLPDFTSILLYFTALFLISEFAMDRTKPMAAQSPKLVGLAGNLVMLYMMAFVSPLDLMAISGNNSGDLTLLIVMSATAFAVIALSVYNVKRKNSPGSLPAAMIGLVYPLNVLICIFGSSDGAAAFLEMLFINGYLIAFGIMMIVTGFKEKKTGQASVGAAVIAVWIFMRFFMTDLDFLVRGMIFIAVGAAFLCANLFLSKKIKKESGEDSNDEED